MWLDSHKLTLMHKTMSNGSTRTLVSCGLDSSGSSESHMQISTIMHASEWDDVSYSQCVNNETRTQWRWCFSIVGVW